MWINQGIVKQTIFYKFGFSTYLLTICNISEMQTIEMVINSNYHLLTKFPRLRKATFKYNIHIMQDVSLSYEIMVIDDNEIDIFVTRKLLDKSSIKSKTYYFLSALDAIDFLKSTSSQQIPKFIFLDMKMPHMDGFEFIETVQKEELVCLKHSEICILSSTIDPSDKKKVQNFQIVKKVVHKPLSLTELKSLLEENLILN